MKVLLKPLVTEKVNAMAEKFNRYGFLVDIKANKLEIKKAVEEMYNGVPFLDVEVPAGGAHQAEQVVADLD